MLGHSLWIVLQSRTMWSKCSQKSTILHIWLQRISRIVINPTVSSFFPKTAQSGILSVARIVIWHLEYTWDINMQEVWQIMQCRLSALQRAFGKRVKISMQIFSTAQRRRSKSSRMGEDLNHNYITQTDEENYSKSFPKEVSFMLLVGGNLTNF